MTLLQIRIVLGIAAALAIFGVLKYTHDSIYQSGYDQCTTDNNAKVAASKDAARAGVIEGEKQHDKEVKELVKKGDTGYGVGARTTDAIDRLRTRHGG